MMLGRFATGTLVSVVLSVAVAQSQPPPPTAAQKPPVFRAGAHYVRVDAYPTTKDGKIVEGLTKGDFEIEEDGKPQAIESAEFITFDTWTPDAERKDPRTQQDAYDLLGDPTWRVFVIVIDRAAYGMVGQHYMRGPLHEFIDRNLGPRDLFGLLSTESAWTDLTLGQKTTTANAVIDSRQWINPPDFDERYLLYYECGLGSLIGRKKLDETYELLEGLVKLLGLIRQEKKSIVFVTNGLEMPGPARGDVITMPDMPKIGITNGRVGEVPRAGDRIGGPSRSSLCAAERMRLINLDFGQRFRDLLASARQGNVAFYPISPAGLQGMPFYERGGVNMGAYHAQNARTDTLRTLASETDGIAIVNTNNLAGGMRRIADDLHAYYVLGYYTTNTNWDGRVRSIKVRLKPKRDTIRARRQYRAPTLAEFAALSASSSAAAPFVPSAEDNALALLAAARPSADFATYSALAGRDLTLVLEASGDAAATSRWPDGADVQVIAESADGDVIGSARERLNPGARVAVVHVSLAESRQPVANAMVRIRAEGIVLTDRVHAPAPSTLVGDAIAYRNGAPAAVLMCARTDAVRFEWAVLAPLESREARLLDRKGQPLSIKLPVSENQRGSKPMLVAELALSPLGRGDYLVELVARGAGVSERKLLALRVK